MMQTDLLADMKKAETKAIEEGQDYRLFAKDVKPMLQKAGWWGKKTMSDPLTGREVEAQLGSDRRLKVIYETNMRSAYLKGSYDRSMASDTC
ncbi:MAG: hypothetical protein ACRC4W_02705 [Treponemataceae bacterium]